MKRSDDLNWRPINTAPHDGTTILLRGGDGPHGITYWEGRGRWAVPRDAHQNEATWLHRGSSLWEAGYTPTEWAPMDERGA